MVLAVYPVIFGNMSASYLKAAYQKLTIRKLWLTQRDRPIFINLDGRAALTTIVSGYQNSACGTLNFVQQR
jgi:hypothetical protein